MKHLLSITVLLFAAIFSTPSIFALPIENEAGQLATQVTDTEITELVITGTVNAIDFKYIRENLLNLDKIDLSGATITECDYVEDETTTHYNANTLPDYALFGLKLNDVKLPSNLTSIGECALAGNTNLQSIILPGTLTSIGDNAFNSTGLTSVTLPEGLTDMGTGVFAHCKSLTLATILPSEEFELGDEAFMDCTALQQAIVGGNVTSIGKSAFAGCSSLNDLVLNDPSSLSTIKESAFESCGMDVVNLMNCSNLTTVGMYAFAGSKATRILLPPSVTEVGEGAFFYNKELEIVNLPEDLTSIADYLLAGCNNYSENDMIGRSVTSIGDYAFYNWDQIATLFIPSSVNYIGTKAMAGMTGLTKVTAKPMSVPDLGEDVWDGVEQSTIPLKVDESVVNDYTSAAQWKEFRIESVPTEIDDIAETKADVTARFAGSQLLVTSSIALSSVSLYTVNGVLLSNILTHATTASIETINYSGNIYIVTVVLSDGSRTSFKLIRD